MNEPEPDLDAIAEERAAAALALGPSRWVEPRKREKRVLGTHNGHLSDEFRRARVAKNARNRSRRGQGTRPPGTQRSGSCRRSRRASR